MADDRFPGSLTTAAGSLIETLALVEPRHRAVVICFDPRDPSGHHTLDSNAAAADLVLVLRAALGRLESGALRMPVGPGCGALGG